MHRGGGVQGAAVPVRGLEVGDSAVRPDPLIQPEGERRGPVPRYRAADGATAGVRPVGYQLRGEVAALGAADISWGWTSMRAPRHQTKPGDPLSGDGDGRQAHRRLPASDRRARPLPPRWRRAPPTATRPSPPPGGGDCRLTGRGRAGRARARPAVGGERPRLQSPDGVVVPRAVEQGHRGNVADRTDHHRWRRRHGSPCDLDLDVIPSARRARPGPGHRRCRRGPPDRRRAAPCPRRCRLGSIARRSSGDGWCWPGG